MQVVIIGGGTAGTTCAFELRKLNKDIKITIIEKTDRVAYSPCAMPYLISGKINDLSKLFLYSQEDYQKNQIDLLLNCEATNFIDNKVICSNKKEIQYDVLVLAMGAKNKIPNISGIEQVNYNNLKTIEDAQKIYEKLKANQKSVIIGAGMIGIELADALVKNDEQVILLEKESHPLPKMLDEDMAKYLEKDLENIELVTNAEIVSVSNQKLQLQDREIEFDKLFVCTGFDPNLDLAQKLDLKITKGINVDQYLQTSKKDVYAIGDCVEINVKNCEDKNLSQLGTLAVNQAKLVAKNILEQKEGYSAALNTQITKINNCYVGSVGLQNKEEYITAIYKSPVKSSYYSEEEKMVVKLLCQKDGLLVGGQIIGHAEVAGHLHTIALAISQEMNVNQLAKLETSYNPTVININNPLVKTAEILEKKVTFLKNKE